MTYLRYQAKRHRHAVSSEHIGMGPAPLLQLSASMISPPFIMINIAQKKSLPKRFVCSDNDFFTNLNVHANGFFVNRKDVLCVDNHGDQFYIFAGMIGDGMACAGRTNGNVSGGDDLCFAVITVCGISF